MLGGLLDFLCNIQEQNKHANLGKASMRKVHNDDKRETSSYHNSALRVLEKCLCEAVI